MLIESALSDEVPIDVPETTLFTGANRQSLKLKTSDGTYPEKADVKRFMATLPLPAELWCSHRAVYWLSACESEAVSLLCRVDSPVASTAVSQEPLTTSTSMPDHFRTISRRLDPHHS
jgi:hypothetical protein